MEIAIARDRNAGVVAPLLGIADLVFNSFQLHNCLLLGGRGHPGEALNIRIQSGFDRMYDLDRASFTLRREGAIDIGLAQSFAEVTVCGANAAAPARLQFLCSRQRASEEVEV